MSCTPLYFIRVTVCHVTDKLDGIVIDSDELEKEAERLGMSKVPNFLVLGNITLSECEQDFLNVHYKCREVQKLKKLDLEVEISKLATKHRYEKMGQGDLLEELDENEMI